ncbi:hypothetical protein MHU86_23480 [Fragilaria crotonensis]|nr:hypothetical protein MHU86_23480 [Fragilaria crotonensis]
MMELKHILEETDVMVDDHLTNVKGVVPAIYSVTGALTYVGDVEHVTTGEAPIESADVLSGWQYAVTNDGNVILSEIDPKEWMIAIEYKTLEEFDELYDASCKAGYSLRAIVSNGGGSTFSFQVNGSTEILSIPDPSESKDDINARTRLLYCSMEDAFSNAVREALGGVPPVLVPCAQPYPGVKLLNLIPRSHIRVSGLFRRKRVFGNPGNSYDSLLRLVDHDDDQREELETIVTEAVPVSLKTIPINSMTVGFNAFMPLQDMELAGVGLKTLNDCNWKINCSHGQIEKKSLSIITLTDFLERNRVAWRPCMSIFEGVVTAIYYITGGVRYIGDSELVTTDGVQLDPTTPTRPVNIIAAGWHYVVNNAGQVQLFETDPTEWIVAIEYQKLKEGTDHRIRLVDF